MNFQRNDLMFSKAHTDFNHCQDNRKRKMGGGGNKGRFYILSPLFFEVQNRPNFQDMGKQKILS